MSDPIKEIISNCEFWMLPVEGGKFTMGSADREKDSEGFEKPQHEVIVSDFYIGKFPVTQALWQAVWREGKIKGISEFPSGFKGENRPVEQVSWDDIRNIFLPALQKITGKNYRLPTESEWEYAARGGKHWQDGYKYAGSDRLKDIAWFSENSGDETKSVGLKYPNQLGIHDLSGNVWEWCEDDWHSDYNTTPPLDGSAWIDSPRAEYRVIRGGGWAATRSIAAPLLASTTRPATGGTALASASSSPFSETVCPFPLSCEQKGRAEAAAERSAEAVAKAA